MKRVLILGALAVAMVGCGPRPQSNGPEKDIGPKIEKKIIVGEDVKFPAAILIQGGEVERPLASLEKPTWRLYVCLRPTSTEITGGVNLYLNDMGTPILRKLGDGQKSWLISENAVQINYRYNSLKLERYEELVYGDLGFLELSSITNVFDGSTNSTVTWSNDHELNWGAGTLLRLNERFSSEPNPNGKYSALQYTVVRVGMNDKKLVPIEACEEQNNTMILLTGKDIK